MDNYLKRNQGLSALVEKDESAVKKYFIEQKYELEKLDVDKPHREPDYRAVKNGQTIIVEIRSIFHKDEMQKFAEIRNTIH